MPKRKIKQELIEGTVIVGDGFVIVRKNRSLVPVNRRDKLQKIPKKTRPPLPGTTRRAFIKGFELYLGNITRACRYAGISRTTLYRWLRSESRINKRFKEHLQNTQVLEAKKDHLEGCLMDIAAGMEGNAPAVIFGLKSLAQDRGYRDRPDVQVNVGRDDTVAIELAKLRRQFEAMAARMGTDPDYEARLFLEEFESTLNPAIRSELVSELKN